jgi:putative spermidine/putrescine transport system permease protein
MTLSRRTRWILGIVSAAVLVFIYFPLVVVVVNSFNASRVFSWPPTSFTLEWWQKAWTNDGVRAAILTSVKAGIGATTIAIVLGAMISFAVSRYDFFGREPISFVVILPIALPGIITGIALNSAFNTVLVPLGITFGLFTVILGHATFCIVVVFNNVLARLRRTGTNLEEAAMDLGAGPFQTFRDVTFPAVRSALVAGALLAFALSFDEIVVTTFTAGPGIETLPQWIFNNLFRPNQGPIINAVAAMVLVAFILPVYLALRMSETSSTTVPQVGAEP